MALRVYQAVQALMVLAEIKATKVQMDLSENQETQDPQEHLVQMDQLEIQDLPEIQDQTVHLVQLVHQEKRVQTEHKAHPILSLDKRETPARQEHLVAQENQDQRVLKALQDQQVLKEQLAHLATKVQMV